MKPVPVECLRMRLMKYFRTAGAAIGLLRLQDTYRLSTKDLADGIVGQLKTSRELTGAQALHFGVLSNLRAPRSIHVACSPRLL